MIITLAIAFGPALVAFILANSLHFGHKINPVNRVGPWWRDCVFPPLVVMGISIFISLGITVIALGASVGKAKNLEAFYYENAAIFQESTEEMKEGVRDSQGRWFDAARLNHITVYSGHVRDYRDNVIFYNQDLRGRRYWENNMFLGWMNLNVDPEVKTLPSLGMR